MLSTGLHFASESTGRSKIGFGRTWSESWLATTRHGFATAFLISSPSTADAGGSPFRPAIPIGMASLATVRLGHNDRLSLSQRELSLHVRMIAGLYLGARHWVWNHRTDIDQKERLNWSIMVNRCSTRRDERAECRSA
jgi:hypothetical protein